MSDSSAAEDESYVVEWSPTAVRHLERLPPKVSDAVVEFCHGTLARAPRRVGRPLQRELTGLWSVRRSTYHIIYAIDDGLRVVSIDAVGHRRQVYGRH